MIGRFKCQMCKHSLTEDYVNEKVWKCEAFPNGIPDEKIAFLRYDPCDNCNNGIGFEPREDNNKPSE